MVQSHTYACDGSSSSTSSKVIPAAKSVRKHIRTCVSDSSTQSCKEHHVLSVLRNQIGSAILLDSSLGAVSIDLYSASNAYLLDMCHVTRMVWYGIVWCGMRMVHILVSPTNSKMGYTWRARPMTQRRMVQNTTSNL